MNSTEQFMVKGLKTTFGFRELTDSITGRMKQETSSISDSDLI